MFITRHLLIRTQLEFITCMPCISKISQLLETDSLLLYQGLRGHAVKAPSNVDSMQVSATVKYVEMG